MVMSDNNLLVLGRGCLVVANAIPSQSSVTKLGVSILETMEAYGYKRFYNLHPTHYGTKATHCIKYLMTFSTTQSSQRCRCWKSGGVQKQVL